MAKEVFLYLGHFIKHYFHILKSAHHDGTAMGVLSAAPTKWALQAQELEMMRKICAQSCYLIA